MANLWWIVLADATDAWIYEALSPPGPWKLAAEVHHPESRARVQDLVSDRPGRVRQSGTSKRPAMETQTPVKKREAHVLVQELASELKRGVDQERFEAAIIAAPPALVGVLRKSLDPSVAKRVRAFIDKDYVHLEPKQAKEHLSRELAHEMSAS
jgi:protein required for attachment to host cells